MIKFLLFITFSVYCSASGGGYGGSGASMRMGSSDAYGAQGMSGGSGGYGMSQGMGMSHGMGQRMSQGMGQEMTGYPHQGGPITAAVQTRHSVEVRPVPTQYTPMQPQVIEVDSGDMPIILSFNSRSSRLMVQQTHTPSAPGEVQSTSSEDEPHRLVHEVLKPVIQEVREVITPYRRVIQEVRPVVEEVHTVIAKGEGRKREEYPSNMGGGGGYGSGAASGGYGSGGGMSMASMGLGGMTSDGGYGSSMSKSNMLSMGGSNYGRGLSMGSMATMGTMGTSSTKAYKS